MYDHARKNRSFFINTGHENPQDAMSVHTRRLWRDFRCPADPARTKQKFGDICKWFRSPGRRAGSWCSDGGWHSAINLQKRGHADARSRIRRILRHDRRCVTPRKTTTERSRTHASLCRYASRSKGEKLACHHRASSHDSPVASSLVHACLSFLRDQRTVEKFPGLETCNSFRGLVSSVFTLKIAPFTTLARDRLSTDRVASNHRFDFT